MFSNNGDKYAKFRRTFVCAKNKKNWFTYIIKRLAHFLNFLKNKINLYWKFLFYLVFKV